MTSLRFQPSPHPSPTAPPNAEAVSAEFDALADLFLADAPPVAMRFAPDAPDAPPEASRTEPVADVARPASAATATTPEIEALILGHLPVFGSAWVTQYAKSVAEREQRPVALLRVQAGETWLDLVLPRGVASAVRSRIGTGTDGTLDAALAHAATQTPHWLLRVDDTAEADLAALSGLAGVTILTGADDPAVVASYRTIKNLAGASGEERTPVRVAVMGADDASATAAEAKITKTTALFLSTPLDFAPRVEKVGACSTASLHRSKVVQTPADILTMIHVATTTRPAPTDTTPRPSSVPTVVVVPQSPAPVATPTAPSQHDSTAMLDTCMSLLGLRPLAFACPVAPGVRLAAGDDGSLHLVTLGDSPNAERGLLGAASWADQHAALLEAAHPGTLTNLKDRGPTLHAVVQAAKPARPLIDTGVQVHLAVTVNGQTTLCALN